MLCTPNYEEGSDPYTLGPISLTLQAPAILFITGGNGSGKSTLAKILCGLYIPDTGTICLDGKPVGNHNLEAYRQLFSVVFYDFYLFDTLLGLEDREIDEAAQSYLRRLSIDDKVCVREGCLSTTHLSSGQCRRLALLAAKLEDSPICVFDEWAADQDASFKARFYQELIQDLKNNGKIVIIISHDDSYFSVADQVIKLEDG